MGRLRKRLGASTIYDCGANQNRRLIRRVADDGTVVVERVPSQAHAKFLTAVGNVVRVPLSCGSKNVRKEDPAYSSMVRHEQRLAGHVLWGRCPLHDEYATIPVTAFPERLQKACELGTYNEEKPCPHVLYLRKTRQAQHVKRRKAAEQKRESAEQKRLELERERLKSQDEVLKLLLAERAAESKDDGRIKQD